MNTDTQPNENNEVQPIKRKREPKVGDAVWFLKPPGVRVNDQIMAIEGKAISGKFNDLTDKEFQIITAEFSY